MEIEELAKLIKEDVEWLKEQQMGCCTHKLDDRLAICVGWSEGFGKEKRDDVIQADEPEQDFAICAKVAVHTSDDLRTDLDFINMPYHEDGEVIDTNISIDPKDLESEEDLEKLAKYLLDEYDSMKDLAIDENGLIEGEEEVEVEEEPIEEPEEEKVEVEVEEKPEEIEVKDEVEIEEESLSNKEIDKIMKRNEKYLKWAKKRDSIDAKADDKKEKAKAELEKEVDDADADRDEEKKELKEAPVYAMEPEYDGRKSFYGKAHVDDRGDVKVLYSYNTPVAMIKNGEVILGKATNRGYPYSVWKYSPTTIRHVKEFLKQNGFSADSLKQMEKDYKVDFINESYYHDFLDDEEKMADFKKLSRDEFLKSYSYLTPEEYDLTVKAVEKAKNESLKEDKDEIVQFTLSLKQKEFITTELELEEEPDFDKEWIISNDKTFDPEEESPEDIKSFPYVLLIDGEFFDTLTSDFVNKIIKVEESLEEELCDIKLTIKEKNILDKLTHKNKMDSWFYIDDKTNTIRDLEDNNKVLNTCNAILDIADGTDNVEDFLEPKEVKLFKDLVRRCEECKGLKEDKETQKKAAFENACDCLKFGYGKDKCNFAGLSNEEADEVWKKAFEYMSKEESVNKKLDDIDAKADNKKELAKKKFMKAKDDADADRDEEKKELKESSNDAAVTYWANEVSFQMNEYFEDNGLEKLSPQEKENLAEDIANEILYESDTLWSYINEYIWTLLEEKTQGIDESCKKSAKKKKLKESYAGEDVIADLIDRAKLAIDDGEDVDEAVTSAIDDGLIYTEDIITLGEHYGVIDTDQLMNDFYEELYSDMYGEVEEYYDEKQSEVEDDEDGIDFEEEEEIEEE